MHYLGIDVSKASLEFSDASGRLAGACVNSRRGARQIVAKANKRLGGDVHVVLEPTSTYHHLLVDELSRAGIAHTVINPARTKAYATSLGKRAKTDKVDAHLLASLGEAQKPRRSYRPDPVQEQLRSLRRHREAIEQDINSASNRLEAANHSPWRDGEVIRGLRSIIRHLKRQAEVAERKMGELIAADETCSSLSGLLQTVPGVGPRTAQLLLAEMPPVWQCDSSRTWVAFAGVCPQTIQSGASNYSRLSRIGSRRIRAQLYMAAVAAMRCNPAVAELVERLKERGKTGKLAVMAAMNKLIRICYGIIKTRKPFDPTLNTIPQNT